MLEIIETLMLEWLSALLFVSSSTVLRTRVIMGDVDDLEIWRPIDRTFGPDLGFEDNNVSLTDT